MGMFRRCNNGWSHSQFGNFCQLLLANSVSTSVEEFATWNKPKIPANKLTGMAKELEKIAKSSEFCEHKETMLALVEEMKGLSKMNLPLDYS